jgi:hypothetical protein
MWEPYSCEGLLSGSLWPQQIVRMQVQELDTVVRYVLLDIPGLLFFSTYTLLVLFWAEIYHQAKQLPTSGLRPTFVISNVVVYIIQVSMPGHFRPLVDQLLHESHL